MLGEREHRGETRQQPIIARCAQRCELAQLRRALAVVAHRLSDQRLFALAEPGQPGGEDEVAGVLVVIVVVDRHADVVEHAGGPQQLGGVDIRRRRRANLDQPAPKPTGKVCDVLWVREVSLVLARKVPDRRLADVGKQRWIAGPTVLAALQIGAEEDALAQAGLGDLQLRGAGHIHCCANRYSAREDDARALRLDPGDLCTRAGGVSRELLRQLTEHVALERIALNTERRASGRVLGGRREVAYGAADPDQLAAQLLEPACLFQLSERVRA